MAHTDVHLPWRVKDQDPYWKTIFKNHSCGCWMCVGQGDRKLNVRRQRAAQRATLTELVKFKADRWGVDYHIPKISKWSSAGIRSSRTVLGKGQNDIPA